MESIDIETILTIIFVLVDDWYQSKAMAKNQETASLDVNHPFQTVRS